MKRRLCALLLAVLTLCSCVQTQSQTEKTESNAAAHMVLRYADQFTVDYDADGRALVTIGDDRFLVVPEGVETREETGATTLCLPLRTIYTASSAAMDPFVRLDALDTVRLTGTKREDWSLPEVQRAMDAGTILYAGKYAAPDYELLLAEGTALAVENTMIYHSPETKEQLEELGIPVLVERSSYESHPLGRLEWIKLYGLLTGKTAEAEAFFNEQAALAESIFAQESTGKTAAFFFLTASGGVNVRRPEDYVAKMISLAGGRYVFDDLAADDGSARSTMNMQTEDFYVGAKDADVLIYNATIDGGMETMTELLVKADWLADFRAVQSGNVWCTEADLFQQTSGIAAMIDEFHRIFSGTADETALQYFHKLS
ncbi:MAG: ABC transporter substrate-binding protein [Ruminococcaceae bacterium]|nr:ABC transporter substrate-binding protein [Oscillospiraceae bacterium]